MYSKNLAQIHSKLIEISCLVYVLKIALDNTAQPIKDTTPFSKLANVIEHKINSILEKFSAD